MSTHLYLLQNWDAPYAETLRKTYKELPESADYVMYWWHFSAKLTKSESIKKFGLISTNSIRQSYNLGIIDKAIKNGISITFAIPDHPWVDNADGAAVRVAMTFAEKGKGKPGQLLTIKNEEEIEDASEDLVFHKENGSIAILFDS